MVQEQSLEVLRRVLLPKSYKESTFVLCLRLLKYLDNFKRNVTLLSVLRDIQHFYFCKNVFFRNKIERKVCSISIFGCYCQDTLMVSLFSNSFQSRIINIFCQRIRIIIIWDIENFYSISKEVIQFFCSFFTIC